MSIKNTILTIGVLLLTLTTYSLAQAETAINLTIRTGDNIIFEGSAVADEAPNVTLTDSNGDTHEISSNSVLGILYTLDQLDTNFEISELEYFSSFNSLYLKCITSTSGEDCDLWQYVVDNETPQTGMDQNIVSGGENVYIYFSNQSDILLDNSNITTTDTLTVSALEYDYENNAWIPRTGVTIGITQENPDDPWSPIEINTIAVDENGQAVFSAIAPGSYKVGVKEDFYFPTKDLTVTTAEENDQENSENENTNNNSGSSSSSKNKKTTTKSQTTVKTEATKNFDIDKALEFIFEQQNEDGSFGADLYTDWATFAVATEESYAIEKINLIKYLTGNNLPSTELTDIERRVIALMSLGLNPYNTNGRNYIAEIMSFFDKNQFGDPLLTNDDVFALLILQNLGYVKEDTIISKTIEFILAKQYPNGSWNESTDMTGATINALVFASDIPEVKNALDKAKEFLKSKQEEDGGFGNASSTAWVIEGIKALGEKVEDWKNDEGKNPYDALTSLQKSDGGIAGEILNNRFWETSYTISAISKLTWNEVLQDYKRQELPKTIAKKSTTPAVKKITPAPEPIAQIPENNEGAVLGESTEIPKEKKWFGKIFTNIFSAIF